VDQQEIAGGMSDQRGQPAIEPFGVSGIAVLGFEAIVLRELDG
jgi:hypothetical protein